MLTRPGARKPARPYGPRNPPRVKPFPAPVRGWVSAQNLAASTPLSAQILENWFPTQTGIRLRAGSPRYATLDEDETDPVESLMAYTGTTRKLFAALETTIFDITSVADEDVEPTPDVTGQTSGYYSHVNFATSGGYFMPVVNGTDAMLVYNGTDFYPVTDTILYAIDYDAETSPFTEGETLTGGTSAATAVIVKVIDNGTDGTLWVNNVSGTFQNDETITDGAGGSATEDGTATSLIGAVTGSGADTSEWAHVGAYRNRLFFVEGGSLNVWYLPVGSITGAAASLTLSGIFGKGGSVLMTGTWSLDSGAGLDDKLVVVSTEGEVAIFQGSDPSDPDDWRLDNRYEIAPPMGKNCTMKAGGDLLIGTEEGVVPVSAAVNKDPAALSLSAVSRAIEPDWARAARTRRALPWEVVKWPEKNMAIWSIPVTDDGDEQCCFVVNLETGAWAKYTGWNTRCLILHDDQVYFGSNDGRVRRAEVGGYDDVSTPYVSTYVGSWDHLGAVGSIKAVKQARAVFRTSVAFAPKISMSKDYTVSLPAPPNAEAGTEAPGIWDSGIWDFSKLDAGLTYYTVNTRWGSIGQTGFAAAPQIQVTNGDIVPPTAELVIFEVTYEMGGLVV